MIVDQLRRRPDVVWRLGPDRVLVRRIGEEGLDLMGAAALVWIALDRPQPIAALEDELRASAGDVDVASAVSELVSAGVIEWM